MDDKKAAVAAIARAKAKKSARAEANTTNSDEQTADAAVDDKKAAVAAAIARAKAKKAAKAAQSKAEELSSDAHVIDNKSQGSAQQNSSELAEKPVAQSSDDKRKAAIAAAVARAKAKKLNKEGNDQS